jgi:putative flavoprotein involved in K+ transport
MSHADTVIIGAGQAGLALSRHLTLLGYDHVLLEQGRVGERWRSERWDSLALLTPNWANRLPGDAPAAEPDAYLSRTEFVLGLERYARSFGAPVRERTTVLSVVRSDGAFAIRTDRGDWTATSVVIASGDCAVPAVPWFAAGVPAGVEHRHAARYASPESLQPGGVLVVGSGPSGHQIAHELASAGRDVVMAVGRHARIPRRYRGRDVWAWMHEMGDLSRTLDHLDHDPRTRVPATLPLDGRDGGRTLDLGILARAGVRIAGHLQGFTGRHALFSDDLAANAARADERLRRLLARIDAHVATRPDAAAFAPAELIAPLQLAPSPASIDLEAAGISTVVWATGYRPHHPWLQVAVETGPNGRILHERGETAVDGLFVLGQRWQFRATSHQIGGVGEDAAHVAERIAAAAPVRLRAVA